MKIQNVIAALQLTPLPLEGGYFREIYRSHHAAASPGKCCGTCIYYLLDGPGQSAWHRVAADEIWLYHAGTAAIQVLLFPDGHWEERRIGSNLLAGERPQSLIPAGVWQAAVLQSRTPADWGLFGAAVFPGFEYDDFTAGSGKELCRSHPDAAIRIRELGLAD
ncbi:MAG: cupin domain-containing protein [Victivallales bacterium]|nr:cupin domain-containing protein [Victivallales bacterium]